MSDTETTPTPDDAEPENGVGRRTFLERLSIGLAAVIGVVVAIPCVGFVLAPILGRPPRKWRSVGKVDEFAVGATVLVSIEDASPVPWAGTTAKSGAWVRRTDEGEFVAYSINCRHLGCPVRWVEGPRLFMCPCHGGVYYADGSVAGGPPPEPLARMSVRVVKGNVEIETAPQPLTSTKVDV